MSSSFRFLFTFISSLLVAGCLLCMIYPSSVDDPTQDGHNPGGWFSLRDPGSLFAPAATISLTEDSQTFFNAAPAAFGETLPANGLSGRLWIGSGFAESITHQATASIEGELGCDDAPDRPARSQDLDTSRHTPKRNENLNLFGQSGDIAGSIVLLSRGACGFLDKVSWAQHRGAIAVIVADDVPGGPLVRMYARGDASNVTIPSIFTSHTTAHLLSHLVQQDRSVGSIESIDDIERVKAIVRDARQVLEVDNHGFMHMLRNWRAFGTLLSSKHHASEVLEPATSRATLRDGATREYTHSSLKQSLEGVAGINNTMPEQPGLWITLAPSTLSTSPFFNTLFVLVFSPLVTLAIVYSMLLLRSRIRRHRWRAPKSVVQQLPVRVYQTVSSRLSSDPATPLLANQQGCLQNATSYGSVDLDQIAALVEWRRTHIGRQRECVVCLDEYVDGVSRVMSLPCGHEFHVDCITCPICKGDVVRSIRRQQSDDVEQTQSITLPDLEQGSQRDLSR